MGIGPSQRPRLGGKLAFPHSSFEAVRPTPTAHILSFLNSVAGLHVPAGSILWTLAWPVHSAISPLLGLLHTDSNDCASHFQLSFHVKLLWSRRNVSAWEPAGQEPRKREACHERTSLALSPCCHCTDCSVPTLGCGYAAQLSPRNAKQEAGATLEASGLQIFPLFVWVSITKGELAPSSEMSFPFLFQQKLSVYSRFLWNSLCPILHLHGVFSPSSTGRMWFKKMWRGLFYSLQAECMGFKRRTRSN